MAIRAFDIGIRDLRRLEEANVMHLFSVFSWVMNVWRQTQMATVLRDPALLYSINSL